MEIERNNIPLPRPTSATVNGPKLKFEGSSLVVEYDYEMDTGQIVWTRLIFDGVLAYEYRQASCCEAKNVISSQEVKRYTDSTWLSNLLAIWKQDVGWQKLQQQIGGEKRFNHFGVYFDDSGCLDVIAEYCKVE